ncbi:hypothetical protein N9950_02750, partial [Akkermansiaceae bacterium]|nr:hypothetical protein [Akkermansiaceae bacterium]
MPDFSKIPKIILLIWLSLVISIGASLYNGLWSTVFVSMVALVMTALPIIFAERFEVKLPIRFAAA